MCVGKKNQRQNKGVGLANITKTLPVKVLKDLKAAGFIDETENSQKVVDAVKFIWGNSNYLKMQLSSFSIKRQKRLISKSGYSKVDAYIYARYKNKGYGEKIFVQQVLGELKHYYKVEPTNKIKNTIKKIRKKVYDEKRRLEIIIE